MTEKEIMDVVALSIQTYGADQQLNQVNEELAELIVEVAKNKRGFDNRENIIEEMADVLHCFCNLMMILDIKDIEIHSKLEYKVRRTLTRIQEGYEPRKIGEAWVNGEHVGDLMKEVTR